MFTAGDTEIVTVVRPPGRDNFGNPQAGTGSETDLAGCLVAPGGSAESGPAEGANTVDIDTVVYAPGAPDILASDQLRVRGVLHQVVGQPQQWGSVGLVVNLRRSTG